MSAAELVPMGTLSAELGASHLVKNGPMGTRIVAEVAEAAACGTVKAGRETDPGL